jgi:DNA-binding protein HU-beta
MQTVLTTWDVTIKLSQKAGFTPEQTKAFLQAQAELAYEHADVGYPVAGIGILAMSDRPARKLIMRFGPKQGQEIIVPAKKGLKFRVAKAAKDAVFARGKVAPDVAAIDMECDEEPENKPE